MQLKRAGGSVRPITNAAGKGRRSLERSNLGRRGDYWAMDEQHMLRPKSTRPK